MEKGRDPMVGRGARDGTRRNRAERRLHRSDRRRATLRRTHRTTNDEGRRPASDRERRVCMELCMELHVLFPPRRHHHKSGHGEEHVHLIGLAHRCVWLETQRGPAAARTLLDMMCRASVATDDEEVASDLSRPTPYLRPLLIRSDSAGSRAQNHALGTAMDEAGQPAPGYRPPACHVRRWDGWEVPSGRRSTRIRATKDQVSNRPGRTCLSLYHASSQDSPLHPRQLSRPSPWPVSIPTNTYQSHTSYQ